MRDQPQASVTGVRRGRAPDRGPRRSPLDGIATGRGYGGTAGSEGRFTMTAHEGVRYRVLV